MKAIFFGLACAAAIAAPALAQAPQKATATFINAEGKEIGSANFTQTPNGVLIVLDVRGLPAGEHAFHVHQKGLCEAAGKFMSAGGHYDSRGHKHGYMVEGGPHAGDMPNQFVGSDGVLKANVLNANVTLGPGAGTLFGPDGTALVIHAKADDYTSQPAGDAGDRIACAVIKR